MIRYHVSPVEEKPEEKPGGTLLWIVLVVVMAGVVAAAVAFWIYRKDSGRKDDLRILAQIDRFALTNLDGRKITHLDLRGKIWIANFIFTRCMGPCPMQTSTLRALQESLPPEIVFVSITVDPDWDKPEQLRLYAKKHGADLSRWYFLTHAEKEVIYRLAKDQFKLPAAQDTKNKDEFIHSPRYVLVDHRGRIRSFAEGVERTEKGFWIPRSKGLDKLRSDVKRLLEKAPPAAVKSLPAVNAVLNGTCGLLLILGFLFILARKILPHKICMLSALVVSAVFLASYLTYHYYMGSTKFAGVGWTRPLYFGILITHTVLAALVVPLALITVTRALRGTLAKHKKIARWTLPIWLYVSITGVIVYFMLYHWFVPR